jgi:hypothetical protein
VDIDGPTATFEDLKVGETFVCLQTAHCDAEAFGQRAKATDRPQPFFLRSYASSDTFRGDLWFESPYDAITAARILAHARSARVGISTDARVWVIVESDGRATAKAKWSDYFSGPASSAYCLLVLAMAGV